MERFEDVSSLHKSSAEEFERIREDARDAAAMFNDVKLKR